MSGGGADRFRLDGRVALVLGIGPGIGSRYTTGQILYVDGGQVATVA
jgi:NAD(P)-dependent dehydrogenase (short-subunit alcohol dehydrogenase family)